MCRINEMLLNLIEQNMSFIAVPMTADNYDTVVTSVKAIVNKHCISKNNCYCYTNTDYRSKAGYYIFVPMDLTNAALSELAKNLDRLMDTEIRCNERKSYIVGYYLYSGSEVYRKFISNCSESTIRRFILQSMYGVLLHKNNNSKDMQNIIYDYIRKLQIPKEPTTEFLDSLFNLKTEAVSFSRDSRSKAVRWLDTLYSMLTEKYSKLN